MTESENNDKLLESHVLNSTKNVLRLSENNVHNSLRLGYNNKILNATIIFNKAKYSRGKIL